MLCQLFVPEPVSRSIHIRNFRYGKDPSVIRCNRGDTLHLTFSSDDTGHSFFLEEFNIDAKITPSRVETEVFSIDDPSSSPVITEKVTIIAAHPGFLNYIISKSNYRCHVWCGPMHAFESGKLIIMPNTLLFFSLGCIAGILFIWALRIFGVWKVPSIVLPPADLFAKYPFVRKMIVSRWPQIVFTLLAFLMIWIVIMTTLFGTKVSGRNLGVLLMWAIWLFLLVAVLTPFGGRLWCTVCPLPMIGDWFQRGSFVSPEPGRSGRYNNHFSGLMLKWPAWLTNSWLRLFVFLVLATFSTTLVALPKASGMAVVALILVPTLMAMVWELRAFCRYVCPVSVFITPFSEMSPVALRSRSKEVCSNCKPRFCSNGNVNGWACPYGLNTGELNRNSDCGLCLECTRSCTYNNVTVYTDSGIKGRAVTDMSEAWLGIAIFTTSIFYTFLYLGNWPSLRDYVNIIDKDNWGLFAIYTVVYWSAVLALVPAILCFGAYAGRSLSGALISLKQLFFSYSGAILPLGMMIWIAFVIPMLFVNVTFIGQSLSDPFGWGWDFFGTANIPWHQFIPRYIPLIQVVLILFGLHRSLNNALQLISGNEIKPSRRFLMILPLAIFLVLTGGGMIMFFAN